MADEHNELKEQNEQDYEGVKPKTEKSEESLDDSQELSQQAIKELQEKVAALESQVEAKAGVVTGLEGQLARMSHDFEGVRAAYVNAVEDFKKLAAASNPIIPQESIYGGSIEEIKASMERANKLVANVQESLSKQAAAASVPAGAPVRTEPSTEGLSAKEKINLGLEQARKKKD